MVPRRCRSVGFPGTGVPHSCEGSTVTTLRVVEEYPFDRSPHSSSTHLRSRQGVVSGYRTGETRSERTSRHFQFIPVLQDRSGPIKSPTKNVSPRGSKVPPGPSGSLKEWSTSSGHSGPKGVFVGVLRGTGCVRRGVNLTPDLRTGVLQERGGTRSRRGPHFPRPTRNVNWSTSEGVTVLSTLPNRSVLHWNGLLSVRL